MGAELYITTRSRAETVALGVRLGLLLQTGDVVVLAGGLGGGKTAFVSGAVRGLGSEDPVSSPTFAIVQEYCGPKPIIHADLYRLDRVQELYDIGFEDAFDGNHVVFIEWGDRAADVLPKSYLTVTLRLPDDRNENERRIAVSGFGSQWTNASGDASADRWSTLVAAIAGPSDPTCRLDELR